MCSLSREGYDNVRNIILKQVYCEFLRVYYDMVVA